jgi:hypothetical protein
MQVQVIWPPGRSLDRDEDLRRMLPSVHSTNPIPSLGGGFLHQLYIPSKKVEDLLLHPLTIWKSRPSELRTKNVQLRTSIVLVLVLLWFS